MADFPNFDRLRTAFDSLLGDLADTWPTKDIEYVREEVGYGEYGDALENLVALGSRSGNGFGPEQLRQIEALAAAMHMRSSPLLVQLREAAERPTASPSGGPKPG